MEHFFLDFIEFFGKIKKSLAIDLPYFAPTFSNSIKSPLLF